jgi:hypothetical protein
MSVKTDTARADSTKKVKTNFSSADVVIETTNMLEDFGSNDSVCGSVNVISNTLTAVGLVLGNIPETKSLTFIISSVTVGCRSVRYYCKRYCTFWDCTVAIGESIKQTIKFAKYK